MVLDHHFPPDIRVEKEARSLIRYGHEVHLLCVSEKNETEMFGNIYVHRIFFDRSSIKKRILYATRTRFFNYFYINKWCNELIKLHQKENFSVFHAHDLTTMPFTLLAGKRTKVPVIFDMHEDYVAMLFSRLGGENVLRKFKYFLLNILPLEIWERISLALSTKIIVVVEEDKMDLAVFIKPLIKSLSSRYL